MKSMYGVLLVQISIPPAAELSNPIYTLAVVGVVGFVDPLHELGPHVISLVVRVDLFNVRGGNVVPFTRMQISMFVAAFECSPCVSL